MSIVVEDDCSNQGASALSEGCMRWECQSWAPGATTPTRPTLVARQGVWRCPVCEGCYGPALDTSKPLSASALAALRELAEKPAPRQEFNPGVAGLLTRRRLAESIQLPSPYKTHGGRNIEFLRLTSAGRAAIDG